MENIDNSTKMGADSSAENTPNAPELISPKVLDFNEKRLHWASVVRAPTRQRKYFFLQKQETFQKMPLAIYPPILSLKLLYQLFEYT